MLAGTVAAAVLSEASVTVVATGAAADRVTVAVEVPPPATDVGFSTMLETEGTALIESDAVGAPPLSDAVIVEVPAVRVVVVVTVKVAVVAPARTVTEVGTVASEVLLEVRLTTLPPVGAATLRVTVPVEVVPPRTVVGLRLTEVARIGVTVRVAVLATALAVAVIVEVALVAVTSVVIGNVAEVAPAATVTEAPTVATVVLLDVRVTTWPPVAAGMFRVTVPVEPTLPMTDVGLTVTLAGEMTGAKTVKVFAIEFPRYVAVIVTGVFARTAVVAMLNVLCVPPAGTDTEAGTDAAVGLLDVRVTVAPPAAAGEGRMTWFVVVVVPPVADAGLIASAILLVVR